MKPRVYVETTVVSYLSAWPSTDAIVAGHQQSTRLWWGSAPERFEMFVSDLVIDEASAGDAKAAEVRLATIQAFGVLSATETAYQLAEALLNHGALPAKAADDALHVAIATTNGLDFLVTWNLRHINNATMRPLIELVCRQLGYAPPVICTPEELLSEDVP